MRLFVSLVIAAIGVGSATAAFAQEIDWAQVDEAAGRKAATVSGDAIATAFHAPTFM